MRVFQTCLGHQEVGWKEYLIDCLHFVTSHLFSFLLKFIFNDYIHIHKRIMYTCLRYVCEK